MKTFTLTLSLSERQAIDWIGHRYAHGDDLRDLLDRYSPGADDYENDPWYLPSDIDFVLDETAVEQLEHIAEQNNLTCFAEDLCHKIYKVIHDYNRG